MQEIAIPELELWGNSLTAWVLAATVAVVVILVLRLLARMAARRLQRLSSGTANDIDDLVADLVDRTKLLFILVVAAWAGSLVLSLGPAAEARMRALLVIGLLLQAAFWANGLVTYGLNRYRKKAEAEDPSVATALGAVGFLLRVGVWAIAIMVALDSMGIDITALIAGLGVGGIAIALAVQSVLGDLFASISIVLDKPFVVGDFIIVGSEMGTVEHVGLKTTRVRSLTGEQLVIANSDLLASRIRNYKRMQERRIVFEIGVVYGTEADKLRKIPEIIRAAVEHLDNTRFDRSHFKAFGDSALVYETVYYMTVPDFNAYMDTQQAINLQLYERFAQEGVEFAYPTQTLFLRSEEPEPAVAG